jgi:hypothetical protein
MTFPPLNLFIVSSKNFSIYTTLCHAIRSFAWTVPAIETGWLFVLTRLNNKSTNYSSYDWISPFKCG